MSESTPDNQTQTTAPTQQKPGEDGDAAADGRITDDMLPEDVRPSDDNPLAKPLDEDADEDSGMSLGPDGPQG